MIIDTKAKMFTCYGLEMTETTLDEIFLCLSKLPVGDTLVFGFTKASTSTLEIEKFEENKKST